MSTSRLLLLFEVLVGTGAAVTFVGLTDVVGMAVEDCDVKVVRPSSAEPPMATGCDEGLLWVKYQPTPIPPPIARRSMMATSHTQVDKRVEPLSVFLSQAL